MIRVHRIFFVVLLGCSLMVLAGCSGRVSDTGKRGDLKAEDPPMVTMKLVTPRGDFYDPAKQLAAYYDLWKSGESADKPGYVKAFRLPEPVHLPWDSDKEVDPTLGAVVLMVPNGTPDELTAEYCVSTDEAMGYGLIISALMEDQALFDQLLRVVLYYKNDKSEDLALWAIPAKRGQDWFQTKIFADLAEPAQEEWRDQGIQFEPLYEDAGSKIIVGESLSQVRNSGSATDGELDIAYALYLAHSKWEQGPGGPGVPGELGEKHYLKLARQRFGAIMSVLVDQYGQQPDGSGIFLPTGDYTVSYETKTGRVTSGLTRPCDFMVAQLRTYYEDTQRPEVLELIESIYAQTQQLADPVTGLVPDFAKWENGALQPCEDDISNEWMSAYFYMNSARFPFRMALDTAHYGDDRGAQQATKIVDFFRAKYGEASPGAIHDLKGQAHPDGLWENPVLDASLYSAAAFSGKPEYQDYVNLGWQKLNSQFDSRHNDWDKNGLGYDPAHSGYFGDTWRLLGLLGMSGKWERPRIAE